jgi:hypothetical protein
MKYEPTQCQFCGLVTDQKHTDTCDMHKINKLSMVESIQDRREFKMRELIAGAVITITGVFVGAALTMSLDPDRKAISPKP